MIPGREGEHYWYAKRERKFLLLLTNFLPNDTVMNTDITRPNQIRHTPAERERERDHLIIIKTIHF